MGWWCRTGEGNRKFFGAFLFLRLSSGNSMYSNAKKLQKLRRDCGAWQGASRMAEPNNFQFCVLHVLLQHSRKASQSIDEDWDGWLQLPTSFVTCPFSLTSGFISNPQINESNFMVSSIGLAFRPFPQQSFPDTVWVIWFQKRLLATSVVVWHSSVQTEPGLASRTIQPQDVSKMQNKNPEGAIHTHFPSPLPATSTHPCDLHSSE